jgi:uncharacterized protein YecE (DUF72 family)
MATPPKPPTPQSQSQDPQAKIRIGTASWTDPTIVQSGWYPPSATTPEARLAYYAQQFPLVEVDSSYYALPSERNSLLWVDRTPPGFTFNFKAFALMTGHGAPLKRLPPIVRDSLPADFGAGKRQIYMKDLPDQAQRWIWDGFDAALRPLQQAGKLGAILLQFPPWFHIGKDNKRYLELCRAMLPDHALAVEFRNASWLAGDNAAETLGHLRDNGLTYVCDDEPQGFKSSVPPVTAVTNPALALVRFHGRNAESWQAKDVSVAERFKYLYTDGELQEWLPEIKQLAEQSETTHVLFNNCYSDYGVRNAAQLAAKLGVSPPAGPQQPPLPL